MDRINLVSPENPVILSNNPLYNSPLRSSITVPGEILVSLDPAVAQVVAERQEKAKQSYREAGYLRIAVVAMYVFIGLSYFRFAIFLGWTIPVTYFVVLALLMRWQGKFGRLVTNDAAYLKARRSWRLSFVLWLVGLPLGAFGYLLFKLATR